MDPALSLNLGLLKRFPDGSKKNQLSERPALGRMQDGQRSLVLKFLVNIAENCTAKTESLVVMRNTMTTFLQMIRSLPAYWHEPWFMIYRLCHAAMYTSFRSAKERRHVDIDAIFQRVQDIDITQPPAFLPFFSELDRMEKERGFLENKLDDANQEIARQRDRIAELERDLLGKQKELVVCEASRETLNARLARLALEDSTGSKRLFAENSELSSMLSTLEHSHESLLAQVAALEEANASKSFVSEEVQTDEIEEEVKKPPTPPPRPKPKEWGVLAPAPRANKELAELKGLESELRETLETRLKEPGHSRDLGKDVSVLQKELRSLEESIFGLQQTVASRGEIRSANRFVVTISTSRDGGLSYAPVGDVSFPLGIAPAKRLKCEQQSSNFKLTLPQWTTTVVLSHPRIYVDDFLVIHKSESPVKEPSSDSALASIWQDLEKRYPEENAVSQRLPVSQATTMLWDFFQYRWKSLGFPPTFEYLQGSEFHRASLAGSISQISIGNFKAIRDSLYDYILMYYGLEDVVRFFASGLLLTVEQHADLHPTLFLFKAALLQEVPDACIWHLGLFRSLVMHHVSAFSTKTPEAVLSHVGKKLYTSFDMDDLKRLYRNTYGSSLDRESTETTTDDLKRLMWVVVKFMLSTKDKLLAEVRKGLGNQENGTFVDFERFVAFVTKGRPGLTFDIVESYVNLFAGDDDRDESSGELMFEFGKLCLAGAFLGLVFRFFVTYQPESEEDRKIRMYRANRDRRRSSLLHPKIDERGNQTVFQPPPGDSAVGRRGRRRMSVCVPGYNVANKSRRLSTDIDNFDWERLRSIATRK